MRPTAMDRKGDHVGESPSEEPPFRQVLVYMDPTQSLDGLPVRVSWDGRDLSLTEFLTEQKQEG